LGVLAFPARGIAVALVIFCGSDCAMWNPRDQAARHRIADIVAIAISIRCEDDARRAMGVLFACCRIVVLVDLIALVAIPGDIPLHAGPASGLLRYSGWPAPQFPADHK
jgi:hypothetical protein